MKRQRRNVLFTGIFYAVIVWAGTTASDETKGDIVVNIPAPKPPVVLTPEQQEKRDWLDKLSQAIPYGGGNLHTFGQASKICDWVAVGTVEESRPTVKEATPTEDASALGVAFVGRLVVISVDTSLYGKLPEKKLSVVMMNSEDSVIFRSIENQEAKPGDRMLVFLTDKWYDSINLLDSRPPFNLNRFEFDRAAPKRTKLDTRYAWSYAILDNKESELAAINMAKGYLDIFGEKGKRDRGTYYEFLCSLLDSPVKRIRDDAESDLVLFYAREKDPFPNLDKLLADERVRKEIKDYLRYLLPEENPRPVDPPSPLEDDKDAPQPPSSSPTHVVAKVKPPPTEPAGTKPPPWKLPLLIGILILGGGAVVWRYLRKKQT